MPASPAIFTHHQGQQGAVVANAAPAQGSSQLASSVVRKGAARAPLPAVAEIVQESEVDSPYIYIYIYLFIYIYIWAIRE